MGDARSLQQAITEGGIETVNFFNGRLLTGQDLSREQAARRAAEARIGLGLGTGIVSGLGVRRAPADVDDPLPGVSIGAGLAVNAAGELLRLTAPETVRLSRIATPGPTGALGFDDCSAALSGTYLAGEGLYLLTLAPARVASGRAASNGLGGNGVSCNIDAEIAAVQFRLIEIRPQLYADLDMTAADFRNRIAYRCFGAGVLADWGNALLAGGVRGDDLLLAMADFGLSPHDVPLAMIGFAGTRDFSLLDADAVQRPLARPDSGGGFLPSLAAPRRIATGHAMLQQFALQHGVAGTIGTITAREHFAFLPPVGVLPHVDADAARRFLAGMTVRGPLHISAEQVEALVAESLTTPAIRSSDDSVIWLYAVAGNRLSQRLPVGDPARSMGDRTGPPRFRTTGRWWR
jgi:hypothetical protein